MAADKTSASGPKHYDLVVVGSGAGMSVLEEGVKRGLRCALVESGKIGGTCLNRGCIPSKILTVPADAVREAEHARKIGVDLRPERLDWDLVARRMWAKIGENEEMEKALVGAPGLDVYRGTGEFTGDLRMRVVPAGAPPSAGVLLRRPPRSGAPPPPAHSPPPPSSPPTASSWPRGRARRSRPSAASPRPATSRANRSSARNSRARPGRAWSSSAGESSPPSSPTSSRPSGRASRSSRWSRAFFRPRSPW